jgi:tetratricopeptide (TPR) repeat protein
MHSDLPLRYAGAVVLAVLIALSWAPDGFSQTQPRPPAQRGTSSAPAGPNTTRLAADLHLNQGMTYAAMRDWENAISEFSKAVDIDGRYAAAYANRGVAYMQQRKYNKALDDLKQAESLSPNDKMIHYNFVALYSLQNQLDRALDSLDRALERGFNNYDALRNDPDLNNVRAHPEFVRVLEKHKVFIR